MKGLITGAGGFLGSYLVEYLLDRNWTVLATDLAPGPFLSASSSERFRFQQLDLLAGEAVASTVHEFAPDIIFHLAAQSFPGVSWEKPGMTFDVNVIGTAAVLDAARTMENPPRVLTICSSAEYAPITSHEPIGEDARLDPSSPYGISKLAEDHLARVYFEYYGLSTIRVRPFYLIGPRKTGDVSSDFARGVVAIERGETDYVSVGNLDVVRDMLDVRDGVEAFILLAEKGRAGEVYNVCSGQGYAIGDILEKFKALSNVDIRERVNIDRLRPIDEMVKIGDCCRLKELGWTPSRPIDRTLKDILEYWRKTEV